MINTTGKRYYVGKRIRSTVMERRVCNFRWRHDGRLYWKGAIWTKIRRCWGSQPFGGRAFQARGQASAKASVGAHMETRVWIRGCKGEERKNRFRGDWNSGGFHAFAFSSLPCLNENVSDLWHILLGPFLFVGRQFRLWARYCANLREIKIKNTISRNLPRVSKIYY